LKIRGTQKKTLFRIYSTEELTALYDNFYHVFVRNFDDTRIPVNQRTQARLNKQRNAVILNILINQGLTTAETAKIQLNDLDFTQATLTIPTKKKGNGRTLPLQATQISVLMDYMQNVRPQLEQYHAKETQNLFLSLPVSSKKQSNSAISMDVFIRFKTQIQSIDVNFMNFNQIRTSVITNWLKVHGLRKTQIMAGHRSILCTEKYLKNDLEQLSEDINKLHPF
jgi:integrase/recombinase XerD